jgi:ACS family hexuronate transporter-like MFS transporter
MGATAGAIIALPVIATVTMHLPWRSIFLIDGLAGLFWIPLWLWVYRRRALSVTVTKAESAASTREVLQRSSTWKLLIARSLTDPVWYFFLFWFPKYLSSARGLPMTQLARIGWVVYLGAGLGTIAGGLLSRHLIRSGMQVGLAYRYTMLTAAVLVPLSPLAALVSHYELSVIIASMVAMAHMAWLVTLTATVIELYPANQVGKAAGLIAMGSGFGGMLSSEIVGYLVTHGGYTPVFFLMAALHPIAIALLWPVFRRGRSVTTGVAVGNAA